MELGPPHDADHLHKFRTTNKDGDIEVMTIMCKQRDCYVSGELDQKLFPPGKIGKKLFWMKKDQ